MCDLKEVIIAGFLAKGKSRIWAEAYARAYFNADTYARHYADGFEESYKQGVLESKIRTVRAVMESSYLTAEEAMDALGVPPKDREELAPLI